MDGSVFGVQVSGPVTWVQVTWTDKRGPLTWVRVALHAFLYPPRIAPLESRA